MTALAETADRQSLWSSTAGVLKRRVEIARWVTFAFSILGALFAAIVAIARPTIRLGGRYPQTEDYNEWFYLQAERTLCCALTFRPALSQSLSPRVVDLEIIELLPALDSSTKCLVVLEGERQAGQHLLAVNISQFDPMPT